MHLELSKSVRPFFEEWTSPYPSTIRFALVSRQKHNDGTASFSYTFARAVDDVEHKDDTCRTCVVIFPHTNATREKLDVCIKNVCEYEQKLAENAEIPRAFWDKCHGECVQVMRRRNLRRIQYMVAASLVIGRWFGVRWAATFFATWFFWPNRMYPLGKTASEEEIRGLCEKIPEVKHLFNTWLDGLRRDAYTVYDTQLGMTLAR